MNEDWKARLEGTPLTVAQLHQRLLPLDGSLPIYCYLGPEGLTVVAQTENGNVPLIDSPLRVSSGGPAL